MRHHGEFMIEAILGGVMTTAKKDGCETKDPHGIGSFHKRIARRMGFQAPKSHAYIASKHGLHFGSHQDIARICWSFLNEDAL
mmetsp:Transcript_76642/g.120799  ORF Transcript_76642/g.120799 Transcript_76642/m.120799 type:complete len:83 (-) Transcript_76642:14-262(-)